VNAELPPLVVPFRGERYAAARLSALLAPPYDVITPDDRARYAARDTHNIVHLILPEATGGADRYARAAALLSEWRRDRVVVQDPADAVYVLAQGFTLPSGERRTRIGMFAAVAAEPFTVGRVRPHERTHAAPKADRLALLEATRTNLESIFLLAPDPDRALAQALARVATRPPDARAELDGVDIRVWVIAGDAARELSTLAGRGPLYIADGHHRYETATAYERAHGAAGRVLSLVVSATDPGLTILPTHRIIFGPSGDMTKLLAMWRQWFDVGRVAPCADRVERLAELGRERTACIVALPDGNDLSLVLKPDAALDTVLGLGKSPAVRALDIARVETMVVQALLAAGRATPSLGYTPDPYAAFAAVRKGGAAAAVLLNPTRVEQVFAVADAGDVMPPKSTYFIPKVPSGIVLRPLAAGAA
jgi:uncharacterized protein (DUF1015 family)